MWTIHIALTSTFQCEYCQCSTFKRCDKSKLKSTSHGGMYNAHYFRRHQTWSTSWKSGKKRRELVIFCAWHAKQHINKYFAPFYPQALLLSFKEVEKKQHAISLKMVSDYLLLCVISQSHRNSIIT